MLTLHTYRPESWVVRPDSWSAIRPSARASLSLQTRPANRLSWSSETSTPSCTRYRTESSWSAIRSQKTESRLGELFVLVVKFHSRVMLLFSSAWWKLCDTVTISDPVEETQPEEPTLRTEKSLKQSNQWVRFCKWWMMKRRFRPTTDTGQEDDGQQDSVDHLPVGGDRDEAAGTHETQTTSPHSVPQSRGPACGGQMHINYIYSRRIKTAKWGKENVCFFHSR